jgi:cell division protein FtsN
MSDSGFREIQLSGKHVVFLFIAGVVAAVAIFLLGVSVGRGVSKPGQAAQAVPPAVEPAAGDSQTAELPGKTTPEQGELKYPEALLGKGDAKNAASAPASSPVAVSDAAPKTPEKPAATPAPSPQAPAKSGAAIQAGPATASDAVWYVPVASFTSSANADKQVAQLKAKGITAKVYDAGKSVRARYRVRVGPLDKAAADAMVAQLRKEGLKPSQPIR